jgi:uncharacterized protein YukE
VSALGELEHILGELRDVYNWITNLEDWQHLAGDSGALRGAAREWSAQATSVRDLAANLGTAMSRNVDTSPGGNWNDAASRAFTGVWQQYLPGLTQLAGEYDHVAKTLNDAADQVDNFNNAVVSAIVEIGVWIAVCVATSWIPGVDVLDAAAAVVRGATLLDRVMGVLRLLLALLRAIGLVFRSKFGKSWAVNFTFLFAARLTVRGALGRDHDPTKGWTTLDNTQMFVDALIGAAAGTALAPVPFLRVSGLTRIAWVASHERILEPLVESPLIGAASSGTFAMVNQGLFLGTPSKQGWGAYWQNVGIATVFGAVGGFGAGVFRAGMAARWPAPANEDEGISLSYRQNLAVALGLREGLPSGLTGMAAFTSKYGSLLVNPVSRAILTTGEIESPGIREARGVSVAPFPPDSAAAVLRPGLGHLPVGSPPGHVVRPGDTLWDIARRQYGSGLFAGDIARRNHLGSPDLIRPGQQLVLPPVNVLHPAPLAHTHALVTPAAAALHHPAPARPVHHPPRHHLPPVSHRRHRPLLPTSPGRSHHA